jgi:hypothetical protein
VVAGPATYTSSGVLRGARSVGGVVLERGCARVRGGDRLVIARRL